MGVIKTKELTNPRKTKIERDVAEATTTVCRILKTHHDVLKDDPEKLSTEFITIKK
jgi:hypothetical protein